MGIFTKKVEQSAQKKEKRKFRPLVVFIIFLGLLAVFLDYPTIWNKPVDWLNQKIGTEVLPHFFDIPFKLGLDLQGGTHLVYQADLSEIESGNQNQAMEGVRDVIERRINLYGVAEPVVQINKSGSNYRLIVELAGIRNVAQAIEMIGQTPSLDFRERKSEEETERIIALQEEAEKKMNNGEELNSEEQTILFEDPYYQRTELTGRFLEDAQIQFDQNTYQPSVSLQFNSEGSKIFEELTKKNVGKQIAIYLDQSPISAPTVQEVIAGGKAQISGNFSLDEAKELVQRLNAGALPVPIELINQQTVGASLGKASLDQSLKAAFWGFLIILIFIIFFYRLPGLMSAFALLIYIVILLAIFKIIPVTLTLSGIAGFILSVGMAIDANILIFERLKEEIQKGKSLGGSVEEGFNRAWPAIRDGSLSTIITCIILFIFATSLIKGFALTLGIGVLLSMFSALIITKNFLRIVVKNKEEFKKWLWG